MYKAMIAYNTQWLDALAIKKQSGKWYTRGLLSAAQLQAIQEKFQSPFYTPNIFVRIGLGIFCWILAGSVFGLLGITLIENIRNETGTAMVCLLFSAVLFAILEYFIKEKHYYQAGIDDALLYLALSLAITGISLLFSPLFDKYEVCYFLAALPLLLAASVRYTDTLVTALTFTCIASVVFFFLKESPLFAKFIPLACMVFSVCVYYVTQQYKKREALRFWSDCLRVLQACCLLLFYISGNYFIVKDLGEMLFPGFEIHFSFIFWLFTAITPLAYVYFGLKNLDRLLLRTGLVMIVISVITFKYYFSLGHHEVTLTIAGALLITLAYLGIRYLKNNAGHYTYAEDHSDENLFFGNTEALVIAQAAGAPSAPENGFDFGGGRFGGGGAGGKY